MISTTTRKLVWLWAALTFAIPAQAGAAPEAAFPGKPLRLVVPFAAGGLTDALARAVAEPLKDDLRQPVIVDNRAGASGQIGAELVAKGPADGYSIVMLATLHAGGAAYNKEVLRYDLTKDFTSIGMLGTSPAMLIARKDLGVRSIPQLVALAKARPGELSFAAVGAYIGEFFETVADIDLNVVLYRGAAAAANDLLGQNVDMMSGAASDMLQLLKSGKFVALGVSGTTPLPDAPEARPIVESLPAYRGGQWYGLFVPVATPPAVVVRLRAAMARAVASPEYRSRLAALRVAAPDRDADQLLAELRASVDAFSKARARREGRTPTAGR